MESLKEDACLYVIRKFPSVPVGNQSSGFKEAVRAVINNALKVLKVQTPLLTEESQAYVRAEVYKTRDVELARRETERAWNKKREEARQSRRAYRWQLSIASAQEKERLRLERKRYTSRK